MTFIKNFWKVLLSLPAPQLFVCLLLGSFVFRLAFILVFRTYHDLGRYELERTAISLATTGVYGNPYAIPTGPTAHVSPGYTLILAGIFRVFGTGITAELIKQSWASFVTSVQYALVPLAAAVISRNRSVGLIAALVSITYPAKPLVQMDGDWETPYTALFILLIFVAASRLWSSNFQRVRFAAGRGITWGLALLFASVLLPVFISYQVAGAWFQRRNLRTYLQSSAIEVLVAFLCLVPWIVRNAHTLGKPIFTRSNLGLELRVSNNDQASPDQRENYLHGVYARYHPLQNREEAEKVRKLGEIAYNAAAESDAQTWIELHPKQYAMLTLGRMWKFWFYTDPTSKFKTLFLGLTGALGLIGAIILIASKPIPGTAAGLILLLYPAPNYLIHVGLRQRYPIDWLLTLLSVYACFEVYCRWKRSRDPEKKIAAA